MHLGKAILGGLIGAAVGIGLLVAIYFAFKVDQMWTAIIIAVCVGFGVRSLVSTHGHASYVRGAMTALIAVAAFVGAKFIVAQTASMRSAAAPNTAKILAERRLAEEAATDENGAPAQEEIVQITERDSQRDPSNLGMGRPPMRQDFSTWDFVWVCVAGLVAYELGRGAGSASPSQPTAVPGGDPNAPAAS
jgi:hypothetical protein